MKEISARRRGILIATVVTAAVALLAGCTSGSGTTTTSTGGADGASKTVTIAYNTDIEAWSPYAHSSTPTYSRWSNVMEPLVDYDYATKKYIPVLATSWTTEGTKWTFHLRKGVKFQSGNPFTSADVIHSYDRIWHDPDSLQASDFAAVASIDAPDKYTVVITTKAPNAVLLSNMISAFITSKTTFDKYGSGEADHHPDGTGPYSFVSWQPGVAMTVKKNPHYWGKLPAGMPGTLVFKLITSPEDAVAALKRGEIDIDTNLPIQDQDSVDTDSTKVIAIDGTRTMFFAFDNEKAPFDDVKVRQAISYAVDVKGIIKNVLGGEATQSHGPIPSAVYGSDPSLKPYPYDPAKAKKMLTAAGAEGASITLTTTTNRYPNDVEVAQAVQQELQAVGLKVTIATPDFGTFSDAMTAGTLDFYQISRGNYVDAAVLLTQYFQSGVTKRTQYSNPTVDSLLTSQAGELDASKRLADLRKAQALILADAPAVFFGSYKDIYGVTSRVGWTPSVSEEIKGVDITVK